MSEQDLAELLERAADGHSVGAPPLHQMLARSRSARKRRAGLMVVAASVVVGSLIASTTLLIGNSDSHENPADTPPSKIVLDGKWRVVALTDEDGKSVLKSNRVWLIFGMGHQVGGYTECNGFGSVRYKQSGPGGRDLEIPDFARHAQQPRKRCIRTPIAGRLEAVRHVRELDGVLYLQNENRANIATLVRAFQPVTLQGAWHVTAVTDADGKSVPANRSTAKAHISFDGGRMSGNDGCNDFAGRYTQSGPDGHDLMVQITLMTAVGCRHSPTLRLLEVRHIAEENGALYLKDEDWATIAELRNLSVADIALATRIARQGQAKVRGTFIGALAARGLLSKDDQHDTGCPARVLTVRVVWKDDANFEHGHGPVGEAPPDGPLKGALIYVDPVTNRICAEGATYRSVGARTEETLLYGRRPVDPTGEFR